MSYKVGQVLYTIIKKIHGVLPVRVVEQTIKNDLCGEETTYKVLLPNKKSQKVDIEKLENVFECLEDVNNHLLEKTRISIDKMIKDAIVLEEEYFKENIDEEFITCKNDTLNSKIKHNQVKVDLGNGQSVDLENNDILDEKVLDDVNVGGEDIDESITT